MSSWCKDPDFYAPHPGWNTTDEDGIARHIARLIKNPAINSTANMRWYFLERVQMAAFTVEPLWAGTAELDYALAELKDLAAEMVGQLALDSWFVPTGDNKGGRQ